MTELNFMPNSMQRKSSCLTIIVVPCKAIRRLLDEVSFGLAREGLGSRKPIRMFVEIVAGRCYRRIGRPWATLLSERFVGLAHAWLAGDEQVALVAELRETPLQQQVRMLGNSLFAVHHRAYEHFTEVLRQRTMELLANLDVVLPGQKDAEVVRMHLRGCSDAEIEARLSLELGEARTRRRNAYHRLQQG
jgi:hypothetical protein